MTLRRHVRRLVTLCRKEALQIVRDPSTLLIAFLFPVLLVFVFADGINLDASAVRLGLVVEDDSAEARHFADALVSSPFFHVVAGTSETQMADALRAGRVRGIVVVRADFGERLDRPEAAPATVQVITDGAEPNTASFVAGYVRGAYRVWARERAARAGRAPPATLALEERYWFNPGAVSRNFLLPGSITLIMTVVGALLTSLVVAREWERGTMESLLAAGVTRLELVLFKLIPYFVLGMLSFAVCTALTVFVFHVPFRGSLAVLAGVTAIFLLSALGLGLLLSTVTRSQYNAAQAALNAAFLPALMLSGFLFEIASMPAPVRAITYLFAARYFVTALQTLFQAGDVGPVLLRSLVGLGIAATAFLGLTFARTRQRLE